MEHNTSTPNVNEKPARGTSRKPHSGNAGYVTERKSKHPKLPGYFVVYDRDANPSPGIDCDDRWIVMHEPSSYHIGVSSMVKARDLMVRMAEGNDDADFGQHDEGRAAL